MAAASDVAAFRQAQKDVVALAYDEILRFWRTLDLDDPVAAVRALEAYLPDVVQAYGEIGAAVAADFYDDLRAQSPGLRRAYAAVMGEAIPIEHVRAATRWAVTPLFEKKPDGLLLVPAPRPEQALANVVQFADRLIKGQSRRTVEVNVERDPAGARFARVPSGATTCAFCLVMASRGAVYTSQADAEMSKYHGDCDCVPTPIWDGDPLPEGYDPKGLYETYKRAAAKSDGSLKGDGGVLAALRREEGLR